MSDDEIPDSISQDETRSSDELLAELSNRYKSVVICVYNNEDDTFIFTNGDYMVIRGLIESARDDIKMSLESYDETD